MLILNSVGAVKYYDWQEAKWKTGSLLGVGTEWAQTTTKHYMICDDESKNVVLVHEGEIHRLAAKINCDDDAMLEQIYNDNGHANEDLEEISMNLDGFKAAVRGLVNGRDES